MRTPAAVLVAAAQVLVLAAAALVFLLLSQPASGVTVRPDGATVRFVARGAAAAFVPGDGVVVAQVADRRVTFRARELVADYTPDGPAAALRDWYGRQARLAAMRGAREVRLVLSAPGAVGVMTVAERRRGPADLTADVWLLLAEGAGVGLLGVWLLVLKPRDPAARMYAAACAAVTVTGFSGALYDGRDLLGGGWWLWGAQAVNLAGTAACSGALLGLYLLVPRPLTPPAAAWLPVAGGLAGAAAVACGAVPLAGWYAGLLATAPMFLLVVAAQWRAARDRPEDRAVLRYLGAVTVAGMGMLSAFMAAPVLLGVPSLLGDGAAAGPVGLVFAGTALGVRRRRLFELEDWAHRLIGGVGWGLAVLSCDAALVWGLSLTAPQASAAALLIVGLVYFPLRTRLHERAAGPRRLVDLQLFEASAAVAFTHDPQERARRWRDLLRLAYAPLSLRPCPQSPDAPRLARGGAELHLPATAAGPALALAHRSGGRRLFGPRDVELAGELLAVLHRADAVRTEYRRGVVEERLRIAQDLHDDVNARLLTSLHRPQLALVRSDVRQAMADIRTVIAGLSGRETPVAELLADLRFETAERLEAAGRLLVWRANGEGGDQLLEPSGSRALVAGVRELVSNVVKHSGATSVQVDVSLAPGSLQLDFSDDGGGFVIKRDAGKGHGLGNISSRFDRAGGRTEFGGARARLTLRLRKAGADEVAGEQAQADLTKGGDGDRPA